MKLPYNPWPWAIILTFVVFISGTVGLVVMACSQKVELVSANYYEQELKFQGQLERLKRTSQLGAEAAVTYDAAQGRIRISLPPEQACQEVHGQIQFYRPAQADLDRQMQLQLDAKGSQSFDASGLKPGLWKIRVSWTAGKQDYLIDQKLVIPAKPT
jgi:nitrogen fixation protein FixH